jgi:hypothetical protein
MTKFKKGQYYRKHTNTEIIHEISQWENCFVHYSTAPRSPKDNPRQIEHPMIQLGLYETYILSEHNWNQV